jgi:hypothetical protein
MSNLTNQHILLINQRVIINHPTIEYEYLKKLICIINKLTIDY